MWHILAALVEIMQGMCRALIHLLLVNMALDSSTSRIMHDFTPNIGTLLELNTELGTYLNIFLYENFTQSGHLLGWVFYYTSTNPVDFYVDIWRYTSGEIVDMVHTKQIQPNPTGRKEIHYLADSETFPILPGDMFGIHSRAAGVELPVYVEQDPSVEPGTIHGSCDLTTDPFSHANIFSKKHDDIINGGNSCDLHGKAIKYRRISVVPIFLPVDTGALHGKFTLHGTGNSRYDVTLELTHYPIRTRLDCTTKCIQHEHLTSEFCQLSYIIMSCQSDYTAITEDGTTFYVYQQ